LEAFAPRCLFELGKEIMYIIFVLLFLRFAIHFFSGGGGFVIVAGMRHGCRQAFSIKVLSPRLLPELVKVTEWITPSPLQ
jgi:hypothetical protein